MFFFACVASISVAQVLWPYFFENHIILILQPQTMMIKK